MSADLIVQDARRHPLGCSVNRFHHYKGIEVPEGEPVYELVRETAYARLMAKRFYEKCVYCGNVRHTTDSYHENWEWKEKSPSQAGLK